SGDVFKPWDQRKLTSNQLQPILQQELARVAGARIVAFQPPPLPGAFGLPVQFIIQTTEPFTRLNDVAREFLDAATKSGMFIFIDTELKVDLPQSVVKIDRDKTAQLGLKMSRVVRALSSMMGGAYVSYFRPAERTYKVTRQVQ